MVWKNIFLCFKAVFYGWGDYSDVYIVDYLLFDFVGVEVAVLLKYIKE